MPDVAWRANALDCEPWQSGSDDIMTYAIHSIESAPDGAKETLFDVVCAFGFIPKLLGVMAGSPTLLKTYLAVAAQFERASLNATERQIVTLATSYAKESTHCLALHVAISAVSLVPDDVVRAVSNGNPIADVKLEALRRFTAAVVSSRGRPTKLDVEAFQLAGYSNRQALDVVLGIGLGTLGDYASQIADLPSDY